MKKIKDELKKKFYKLKLYQALMVTFSFIFFPAMLVILVTSAVITGEITINNHSVYVSKFLEDLSRNVEYITTDIETKSRFILGEDVVQSLLLTNDSDKNYNDIYRQAREELTRLTLEEEYIESLSIYNFSGNGFTIGNTPSYFVDYSTWKEQEWFNGMLEKRGSYLWEKCKTEGINGEEERIVLGRVINKKDTLDGIGIMIFILDNDYMNSLVQGLSNTTIGDFYILGNDQRIIFGEKNQEYLGLHKVYSEINMDSSDTVNIRKGKYFFTGLGFEHLQWVFVCRGNIWTVLSSQWVNFAIILIAILVVAVIASIIYSKFSHSITRELQKLNYAMEHAEDQDFREEIKIKGIDEFVQLGEAYNRLTNRIHVLLNQVMREKLNTKQAQLDNLQAQINPHFLYNTLDCINWKAMANGQMEIAKMIQSLSEMFRFSLGKGEKEIELAQEVKNIKNYLLLQKSRFQDKLVYLIDVPDDVMKYKVIKFFLQPLVENSILHGIQTRTGKGYVGISGEVINDMLVICVWDNGVGIDEEKISKILNGSDQSEGKKIYGHGIYNVNERLRMKYGEESTLIYKNRKNGGTKVTINIPLSKISR